MEAVKNVNLLRNAQFTDVSSNELQMIDGGVNTLDLIDHAERGDMDCDMLGVVGIAASTRSVSPLNMKRENPTF